MGGCAAVAHGAHHHRETVTRNRALHPRRLLGCMLATVAPRASVPSGVPRVICPGPFGCALCALLALCGCGNDSGGLSTDEIAGCLGLCDKAQNCEIPVPGCRQTCGTLIWVAERLSSTCSRVFDAVPSCAAERTCEELEHSMSGGNACASERTTCDDACVPGLCDLDNSLFFEVVGLPLDP